MSFVITVPLLLIAYLYRGKEDYLANKGYSGIITYFKKNRNKQLVHDIQEKYECCGDISTVYWYQTELPYSCCLNGRCDVLNTILIGCAPKFYDLIKASGSVCQWTALGVSLAGMFGVILSRVIANRHKEDSECGKITEDRDQY